MDTFDKIQSQNRLLYRYIRGSHLYGLQMEDGSSDIDEGGLYIASSEDFFGLPTNYSPQVSDERNDTTWYEIGKFCEMLIKSNSTVLEALFVPSDKQLLKPNKALNPLFENKDLFITKDCFKPFVSYAIEQIHKARGLNKKIVQPIVERKNPLDFCYTFYKQGSTKIENWLEYRGLKQEYCGLVNIPNMSDTIGVYYDWGNHFLNEGITVDDFYSYYDNIGKFQSTDIISKLKEESDSGKINFLTKNLDLCHKANMVSFFIKHFGVSRALLGVKFKEQKPIGYRGIVNSARTSSEIRLSSVAKGEKPICYMTFNKNAYSSHCKDFKEYAEWVKKRNPKRYESNLNKNYDSKNMMHCMRLMSMGQEIAEGRGIILDRRESGDRDFLLDIRNHKFEYDELMDMVNKKQRAMENAIKNSSLKEHIDRNLVNDLLIDIRKEFYKFS